MAETDGTLPVLRFDSAGLAAEEAFWRWRSEFAPFFDLSLADAAAVHAFRGTMDTYHMGSVLVGSCSSVTQTFRRSPYAIARSGVDHYLVQLVQRGHFGGTMAGRPVTARAGDVCIIDMAQPTETTDVDFTHCTLCFSRDLLAPMLSAPDALHGLVLRGDSAVGALLGSHVRTLHEAARHLSARDALALGRGSAAFVAGCLKPTLDALDLVVPEMRAARFRAAKRYIETNLADPELGAAAVAAAVGVSRPTLYRMFEPLGGVSAYIVERRLARSMADLIAADRRPRIADVAYAWGFGSEASFSRAFRSTFGMTPRDARATSAGVFAHAAAMSSVAAELGRWVDGLAAL
ncbi:AraC-like ligand-binding domain-containing protein [Azospirillum sp. ST 5-10]|uniref:AraC-like ligand-binding domain-containing protein n=1 Tax=unclassified Azospirillum TaxID=2630922 RepID=UPI003F4A24ED